MQINSDDSLTPVFQLPLITNDEGPALDGPAPEIIGDANLVRALLSMVGVTGIEPGPPKLASTHPGRTVPAGDATSALGMPVSDLAIVVKAIPLRDAASPLSGKSSGYRQSDDLLGDLIRRLAALVEPHFSDL